MFIFSLKIYDDLDKSPSIFTERSLLNDINHSPRYTDQNYNDISQSNFGLGNSNLLHQ